MTEKNWYVYMLRCEDDSIYTGMARDVEKRLQQHLDRGPQGAKYTRSRPVKSLEAAWQVPDEHAARSLEWHIKHLPRPKKLQLISQPEQIKELCQDAIPFSSDMIQTINKKTHTSK